MPHANGMGDTMSNGDDKPHSQFISHLASYPVVSDSIDTVRNNPLGQRSIHMAEGVYDRLGKPIVPYLRGPASIVAPYAERVDSFADGALNKVEENFPVVKEDTEKVKGSIVDLALYPFRKVGETRDYLFNTYNDEYKKTGGQGIITSTKALLSTELRIAAEFMQALHQYLGPKAQEAKERAQNSDLLNKVQHSDLYQSVKDTDFYQQFEQKYDSAKKQANQGADNAKQYYDSAKKQAGQGMENAKQYASETADSAKQNANQGADTASQYYDSAKKQAGQGADNAKQYANQTADSTKQQSNQGLDSLKRNTEAAGQNLHSKGIDAKTGSKQTSNDALRAADERTQRAPGAF